MCRFFLTVPVRLSRLLSPFSGKSSQYSKPRSPFATISNQQGFTYLMAMFFVVLIGISLMMIGQQWSVTMQRDREAELQFRGNRIKESIERFVADFEVQKGTRINRYPLSLKELTKGPRRYLQTVYKDPLTKKDFELIKIGEEIRGVRSSSEEVPFNQVNFKGAMTYSAIRFEATAPTSNCTLNPLNPLLPANCPKTPAASGSTASSETPSNASSEEANEP